MFPMIDDLFNLILFLAYICHDGIWLLVCSCLVRWLFVQFELRDVDYKMYLHVLGQIQMIGRWIFLQNLESSTIQRS